MSTLKPIMVDGWRGHAAVDAARAREWITLAAAGDGRQSRHARTVSADEVFVKFYPAPAGPKAVHAWTIGEAMRVAGFAVPEVLLVAQHGADGLLVTRDVGGVGLLSWAPSVAPAESLRAKRRMLADLGAAVARLHAAGFVHGDLVPSNVQVRDDGFVWLDNDRTRQSHLLVRFTARRNLVQLGRFVVPGVTTADRWRVVVAYTTARGWSRRARRRLGRWLANKIVERRCRIDHLVPTDAARAGFRVVMRSGGPFDRTAAEGVR